MTVVDAPRNECGRAGHIAKTVLVIDDEPFVAEFFTRTLQDVGFEVEVASSGAGGITAALRREFAAVVLDIRLPDINGLDVLRAISAVRTQTRIVVVSGCLTVELTIAAISCGASHIMEKPVEAEQLVAAVRTPMFARADVAENGKGHGVRLLTILSESNHSVAHRWAMDILRGCTASDDSKTLATWAKRAGTSSTMICERCGMLGIKPRKARDLMRALFAILEGEHLGCPPHVLLDIGDGRTLQTFRRNAGTDFRSARDVESINRFLDSQSFVDSSNVGITVLRSLLARVLSEAGGARISSTNDGSRCV